MADTQEQAKTSLMSLGAQTGAQKAGEFFVDRALNAIVDGCKAKFGNAKVLLGSGFTRYLGNATERYNQVHTIATGNNVRNIVGADSIYVSIGVKHGKKRISTETVDMLLSVSKHILIQGTGGIGKSMMMRYLFLNTANRGEYVPVLLELRKISKQLPGNISVMDLIYTCMKDFDVELPKEQFEFSLRMGKYLFLMDGFDEIKESMAKETAEQIQKFCSKYPNNPCIITTRPGRDTAPLETFTTVKSLPLTKEQAIALAKKIWDEDEKTREFCRQLDEEIYDNEKHREFAENPLLLTMMFLTFMRNNSLPDHLAEFYRQAFEALYSTHDSKNKGAYRREFKCDKLDAPGFRRILSHFCFQSYFKQDYEFAEEKLLLYFDKSIKKFGFAGVSASSYLQDIKKVVCLLVKDGEVYKFAHRSFQAYFAACYTAEVLNDEQQKSVLRSFVRSSAWHSESDYFDILDQLEHERMSINLLEEPIRWCIGKIQSSELATHEYLKLILPSAIWINEAYLEDRMLFNRAMWEPCAQGIAFVDYEELFNMYIRKKRSYDRGTQIYRLLQQASEILDYLDLSIHEKTMEGLRIDDLIDVGVPKTALVKLYDKMVADLEIVEMIADMQNWLVAIDIQRKRLEETSFIDDL